MPQTHRSTLTHYLIEQRRRFPAASGDFNALILDVALACKVIARAVAYGELAVGAGRQGGDVNVQGKTKKPLDVISNQVFTRTNESGGYCAGIASEEMDEPHQIPPQHPRGKYLLVFDPLDGSSNIDVIAWVAAFFAGLPPPREWVTGVPVAPKAASCNRAPVRWLRAMRCM